MVLSPQGRGLGTELSSFYGFHTPWSPQGRVVVVVVA